MVRKAKKAAAPKVRKPITEEHRAKLRENVAKARAARAAKRAAASGAEMAPKAGLGTSEKEDQIPI